MFPEKAERTEKAALDESELSVVALPPTPLKTEKTDSSTSSQILPLARLSSSTLPRAATTTSHSSLAQQVLTRNKPVAEVSPFSPPSPRAGLDDTEDGYQIVPNNSMMDQSNLTPTTATSHTPNNTLVSSQERPAAPVILRQRSVDMENNNDKIVSPVKDKLQKMRRSITEPLMQYFHDITLVSTDVSKD